MDTQSVPTVNLPVEALIYRIGLREAAAWQAGPNDGGIKRGDREDTGDNQADLDEIGTGPAQPTVDQTSLGGDSSIFTPGSLDGIGEADDLDGMEIMQPEDGRLGLVGTDGSPDEDWVAGSGPTMNPAGE